MKASLTPIFTIGEGNRAVTQTTLADQVVIEGIGVHRGQPARVVLHPAEANSGIIFLRTNLPNGRERLIEARHTSVQDTQLCTIIGDHTGASVATIEHLMSALAGLEIDNVLVEVDGPEMPILDGSSRIFVEQILQVGLKRLSVPRKVVRVLRPVRIEMGNAHAELSPYDGFRLDIETEAVIGRKLGMGIAHFDAHRAEHPHHLARHGKALQPNLEDLLDEDARGAIEDRHFRAIDLDQHVVDLKTRQGRHQMLDGGNAGAGMIANNGAELGILHRGMARLDQPLTAIRQVGAQENDTRIRFCRMKNHASGLTAMNTNALDDNLIGQRGLSHGAVPFSDGEDRREARFHRSLRPCPLEEGPDHPGPAIR